MTTAFIAGATGYTGRAVVRVCVERGIQAVAHVRPDSPKLPQWQTTFRALGAEIDTTPWDPEPMTRRLAELQPALVFALLGTTRQRMHGTGDTYDRVDFGLTSLLIDACIAAQLQPRFVYLSAAGVRPGQRGGYRGARAKAEEKLAACGLAYTIARPSFITGPDRDEPRPSEHLGASLIDGALRVASAFGARQLRNRYRSTDNATLARALVRLATSRDGANRVIESEDLRDDQADEQA